MTITLNTTKEILLDKPFDDAVSKLNSIISSNYDNSMYSTFGNLISSNPPEYILMTKWYSIGRPFLAKITSTIIIVKILPLDNKSKILITTKTNPIFYLYFLVFIILAVIALFSVEDLYDLGSPALFFVIAALTMKFDRIKKDDLIERFERDINLK